MTYNNNNTIDHSITTTNTLYDNNVITFAQDSIVIVVNEYFVYISLLVLYDRAMKVSEVNL